MKLFFSLVLIASNTIVISAQDALPRIPFERKAYQALIHQRSGLGLKTKTCTRYVLEKGNVTQETFIDQIYKYNRNGTLNEIKYLDNRERISYVAVFSYRNDLLETIKTFTTEGEVVSTVSYQYSGSLLNKEVVVDKQFGYREDTRYQIDSAKNELSEVYSSSDTDYRIIYSISGVDTGRVLQTTKYNAEGGLMYTARHYYRDDKPLRIDYFTLENQLAYSIRYEYDKNGWLSTKIKETPTKKIVDKYIYQYNDNGLLKAYIKYGSKNETVAYYKYSYAYF